MLVSDLLVLREIDEEAVQCAAVANVEKWSDKARQFLDVTPIVIEFHVLYV